MSKKPNLCETCINYEDEVIFKAQVWIKEKVCMYLMPQRGNATVCKNYEPEDAPDE